jgi:hypothetical protein
MTPDERNEIGVSVAAHQELGPDYDKAVAEGLVERIGEEIDRRVDARLRTAERQAPPPAAPARRGGFGMVLVSLIFGTGATSVVLGNEGTGSAAQTVMVLLIWAAIATINVVYALRR